MIHFVSFSITIVRSSKTAPLNLVKESVHKHKAPENIEEWKNEQSKTNTCQKWTEQ